MTIALAQALDEAGRLLADRSACVLGVEDGGLGMASAVTSALHLSASLVAFEPMRWQGITIGVVGNTATEAKRASLIAKLGIGAIEVAIARDRARRELRARCREHGVDDVPWPLREHAVLVVADHPLERRRARHLQELLHAGGCPWIGIVCGVDDDREAERMLPDVLHRYDGSWAVSAVPTPEPAFAGAD